MTSLISIKIVNWVGYLIIDTIKSIPIVASFYNTFETLLGKFFKPIFYLILYPFEVLGANAMPNYSDWMTFILFWKIGTTFTKDNLFLEVLFFYLPAVISTLNYTQFTWANLGNVRTLNKNNNGIYSQMLGYTYGVLSFCVEAIFAFSPVALAYETFFNYI